ncbi:MAG: type I-E CRISPR-associated protein Cse2/CasB [Gemmataceae bacterium]
MPTPDQETWIRPFIAELGRLLGSDGNHRDAATLAKLRRGLTEYPAERDIWVFGHLRRVGPEHEEQAALLASLFALWHQGGRSHSQQTPNSFGASYGKLRIVTGSESIEKRFASLIDSHADDLPAKLRHAVTLLRSKDIPINWEQLLLDLLAWRAEKRPAQRRWARDFWTKPLSGRFDE